MREIQLSQGKVALVDDEDYEELSKYKWYAYKTPRVYYVRRSETVGRKRQKTILMHRELMKPSKGMYVDHINSDGLDNRRCNLRVCTRQENNCNTRKSKGTSKYKGVSRQPRCATWKCQIAKNRVKINVGCFYNEEDAARAYDRAATEYFGQFARLNFPSDVAA